MLRNAATNVADALHVPAIYGDLADLTSLFIVRPSEPGQTDIQHLQGCCEGVDVSDVTVILTWNGGQAGPPRFECGYFGVKFSAQKGEIR
jgi:hypothetical protein